MKKSLFIKEKLESTGFAIIDEVYSEEEANSIIEILNNTDTTKENFRKSKDLFAIRRFLREVPTAKNLIFTERLRELITDVFGKDFFYSQIYIL